MTSEEIPWKIIFQKERKEKKSTTAARLLPHAVSYVSWRRKEKKERETQDRKRASFPHQIVRVGWACPYSMCRSDPLLLWSRGMTRSVDLTIFPRCSRALLPDWAVGSNRLMIWSDWFAFISCTVDWEVWCWRRWCARCSNFFGASTWSEWVSGWRNWRNWGIQRMQIWNRSTILVYESTVWLDSLQLRRTYTALILEWKTRTWACWVD